MKTGIELIAEERKRQIEKEGYSTEHDMQHSNGELARAAVSYVLYDTDYKDAVPFPWAQEYDKRNKHDYKRRCIIAGAFFVAEVDRLNRVESDKGESESLECLDRIQGR